MPSRSYGFENGEFATTPGAGYGIEQDAIDPPEHDGMRCNGESGDMRKQDDADGFT